MFGHGQVECRDEGAKRALLPWYDDAMPEASRCSVPGCASAWSHAREAHHCFSCGERGGWCGCSSASVGEGRRRRTCPVCKEEGPVDLKVTLFTGADCLVCYEPGPCVVFGACRHAVVCAACAERL